MGQCWPKGEHVTSVEPTEIVFEKIQGRSQDFLSSQLAEIHKPRPTVTHLCLEIPFRSASWDCICVTSLDPYDLGSAVVFSPPFWWAQGSEFKPLSENIQSLKRWVEISFHLFGLMAHPPPRKHKYFIRLCDQSEASIHTNSLATGKYMFHIFKAH